MTGEEGLGGVTGGAAGDGPGTLIGSDTPPATRFDVALTDLDGVVYRGADAVPHAVDALVAARDVGLRLCFVTNNALRTPAEVAGRLRSLGIPALDTDVVTSAQAAARVLADKLAPKASVLVVGGAGLRDAVAERGLVAVDNADDQPAAVVQGYDPELTYARLAEAALAVRAGALWVASNADRTIPTERGLMPGNGSLVAMVAAATGAEPIIAGKPEWALHAESLRRSGARHPLVVGDRLDTDIEAATRAGTASLLVLTGVATPSDVLAAVPAHRPTFLATDLRGLLRPQPGARRRDGGAATCGTWTARVDGGQLTWHREAGHPVPREPTAEGIGDGGTDDGLDALRAACVAAWAAADRGEPVRGFADDRPPGCDTLEVGRPG
ncbi:MAG: HAD-IIA family hydrolase [Frankia sp.]